MHVSGTFSAFSEIYLLLTDVFQAKMLISTACDAAAAGRARQTALLQQIRLIDVLERHGLFANRRRERFQADRPAVIEFDDTAQHPPVRRIEAHLVHF